MRRTMLALLALATFAVAADPKPAPLPDEAKAARAKFEAAVAEARKALDAATRKADKSLAEELGKLSADAAKAGKLDDAVTLRDAAKAADPGEAAKPLADWLKAKRPFVINFDKEALDLGPNGWRFGGWKAGLWGRIEIVGPNTLRLNVPPPQADAGRSHLVTFDPERLRGVVVLQDGNHWILTAKK